MRKIVLISLVCLLSCNQDNTYRTEKNKYAALARTHADSAMMFCNTAMGHLDSGSIDSYCYYVERYCEQASLYTTYVDSFFAEIKQ